METEALIIGIAIVLAALTRLFYHIRPRMALATVSLGAPTTGTGEQMQFTVSLLKDESKDVWDEKIATCFKLLEERIGFQNERFIKLQEEQAKLHALSEEAKKKGVLSSVKQPE